MAKNKEYWKGRFDQVEQAANDKSVKSIHSIEEKYRRAETAINKEINSWYQRFANNNNISMTEARRWLNASELEELKWNVWDYIKHGEENEIDKLWIKELENASAKFHINRLEALKLNIRQQLEQLTGGMTDDIDNMIRSAYKDTYYRTCFEVQKGMSIAFDVAKVNDKMLPSLLSKPWAVDGINFSERLWKNKEKLINTIDEELARMVLTGETPRKTTERISKHLKASKYNVSRVVMTEQAFFTSIAQKDAYKELDVKEYEIVGTLDSITCSDCGRLDGKHRPITELKPGITAPPFHPFCRCTTCPYFNDEFTDGYRVSKDKEGNTVYKFPENMTYEEWKKEFINDDTINVSQTIKITKRKEQNDFSINRDLINSKEYHNKFEGLTKHKLVNESIYQESMKILEHRNGTNYEDIVILDARTGKFITANTETTQSGKVGLKKEQYDKVMQYKGNIVIIHNHPNSSRPSYKDISTLFKNNKIEASVIVGHNGSVHIIDNPIRKVDIDQVFNNLYNEYKGTFFYDELIEHKVLDDIYDMQIFDYRRR